MLQFLERIVQCWVLDGLHYASRVKMGCRTTWVQTSTLIFLPLPSKGEWPEWRDLYRLQMGSVSSYILSASHLAPHVQICLDPGEEIKIRQMILFGSWFCIRERVGIHVLVCPHICHNLLQAAMVTLQVHTYSAEMLITGHHGIVTLFVQVHTYFTYFAVVQTAHAAITLHALDTLKGVGPPLLVHYIDPKGTCAPGTVNLDVWCGSMTGVDAVYSLLRLSG